MNALSVRIGDYGTFQANALHRLARREALRNLGTREASDPTIALLDAWAMQADVLTFYRERLTNESYLRTTSDERTLRELAALVGYKPRPGVAATAYLAYLLDKTAAPVEIPIGAKSQTVPAPGEQMQTFETSEAFAAHADWSQMSPRLTCPAAITLKDALLNPTLRLADTALTVRPGERVLYVFDCQPGFQVMREVAACRTDLQAGYVELKLKARTGLDSERVDELLALRDEILKAMPAEDKNGHVDLLEIVSSYFLGCSACDGKVAAQKIEQVNEGIEVKKRAGRMVEIFAKFSPVSDLTLNQAKPSTLDSVLNASSQQPSRQLTSRLQLPRNAGSGLADDGGDRLSLLTALTPGLASTLPAVLDSLPVTPVLRESSPTVHLLRATAGAFGALAPPFINSDGKIDYSTDWPLKQIDAQFSFLDAVYDAVQPDSFVAYQRLCSVVLEKEDRKEKYFHMLRLARVGSALAIEREDYGVCAKSTRLELCDLKSKPVSILNEGEIEQLPKNEIYLRILRNTLYYVQSEEVHLADSPIDDDIPDGKHGDQIELQTRIEGLQSGQWLIVTGERTDIRDAEGRPVPGVHGGELAMIGSVEHKAHKKAPGDTLHTLLTLVNPLAYSYKRSSAILYGNVVKASHGETVTEVLGSGDARRAGQRFMFSRSPLTFTTAITPAGAEGSEVVRVNGMRYHNLSSLLDADAGTRGYQLDTNESGAATLTFGDGVHGVRLPSGPQNVQVSYRVGIGAPGNAHAEQISLLGTRPLGVNGVINPLRASGGADRDSPERIRRNVPLAVRALPPMSRLVSVQDYADFARLFAGIGHADAIRLSDGAQQVVHVTVAGVDDIALDPDGELLANLSAAYTRYGDPAYPVEIAVRELKALLIQAKVGIDPDADWSLVEPVLRLRVLDHFSFERRHLGQPAYLSEVIAVMQGTLGVAWVDVDAFAGVTEVEVRGTETLRQALNRPREKVRVAALRGRANPDWASNHSSQDAALVQPRFLPAQLAYLIPQVRDLLVLNPG
ncbi:putative baseplate assembly protein [Pseudomonas sp. R5(2019)]|uniref:putative baseplate assembly protein n=1 Tax=Pseudomonas sp. R5(2019) TaxID=2697566 RepID=UPI0014134787|nr:putative baseplate assembly protein [Pseudomonas sp. R5(2019)]NBA93511.1 putative baseplate assembly protein [Pseudomonas sp. R5(2019)]